MIIKEKRNKTIKMLKKQKIRPAKSLGQHLLCSEQVIADIIRTANINRNDHILEVGPGTGALTRQLIKEKANVTAVEMDRRMVNVLRKDFEKTKGLRLIHNDILKLDESILPAKYKIVANLPYQITSPFLRKIIGFKNKPELMILLIQKEVAERITAMPGESKRGFLTLLVALFGRSKIIRFVPRTDFYPEPKVEGALVSIKPKRIRTKSEKDKILTIIKAGFSQKRKKIKNSIAAYLKIEAKQTEEVIKSTGIDPNLRAEDLTLHQWDLLASVAREGKKLFRFRVSEPTKGLSRTFNRKVLDLSPGLCAGGVEHEDSASRSKTFIGKRIDDLNLID